MNKNAVRSSMLSVRQTADKVLLQKKSADICGRFYDMFSGFGSFLMYAPIRQEVDILPLAERLRCEGKRVYMPVVECGRIAFRVFEGLPKMKPGRFGVMESNGEYLDGSFDVIAVPAVAYDISCNRLGYGKGFYDKFLASCGSCVKVGVAYDFQVVSTVYPEEHDEFVDMIITDSGVIRRNG